MQSDSRDRETTTRNPKHYFPTPADTVVDRTYQQRRRIPDPAYNPSMSEPIKWRPNVQLCFTTVEDVVVLL